MTPWAGDLLKLLFGGAGAIFLYRSSREMVDTSREFIQLTIDPVLFRRGRAAR